MTADCPPLPRWSTASFGNAEATSIMDLNALDQHLRQCSRPGSNWRRLGGTMDSLHRGLLARFVTSLTLLAVLAGAAAMVV